MKIIAKAASRLYVRPLTRGNKRRTNLNGEDVDWQNGAVSFTRKKN